MTLGQAIQLFINHQQVQGRSPHTISCYQRDLSWLIEQGGGELDITSFGNSEVDRFLLSRQVTHMAGGKPKASISIGRTRSTVKAFGRWLFEAGHLKANPTNMIRIGRQNCKLPTYLTDDEVRLLLKTIRSQKGWQAERDLVIIQLFLFTGIRLVELVNLNISDVNLLEKRITIKAKGNQVVNRFLNGKARLALNTYLKYRRRMWFDSPALFLSQLGDRISGRHIQRRLEEWVARAGIAKQVHPHTLRHTFATSLYSRTSNILAVQHALGHSSITTSQIYMHMVDDSFECAMETL